MVENKKTTIKFLHQFPDNYKLVPVNGAWGGVSPRGDLLMHFFLEHSKVPQEEIQIAKHDGSLVPLKEKTNEIQVVRAMQIGVSMNREQAVSIANWMLEKVKKYEEDTKVSKKKLK